MKKIRVYELARELGISSKDLIEKIVDLQITVGNHMSTLEDEEANIIRSLLTEEDEIENPHMEEEQEEFEDDKNSEHIKSNKNNKKQKSNKHKEKNNSIDKENKIISTERNEVVIEIVKNIIVKD